LKENVIRIEIDAEKMKKLNEDKNNSLNKTIRDLEKSCTQTKERLTETHEKSLLLEKELTKSRRE